MTHKIRICSDLHLEHAPYFIPVMKGDSDTILILAGDIAPIYLYQTHAVKKFFFNISQRFKAVYYVPGNHEYYGLDISVADDMARDFFASHDLLSNIYYMNMDTFFISEDVAIIGACLWTDMDNENESLMEMLSSGHSDFEKRLITLNGRQFSPEDSVEIHKEHLRYINEQVEKIKDKVNNLIVVTHHGPTKLSIDVKFSTHPLSPSFSSDLMQEVKNWSPSLLVHGHTHLTVKYKVKQAEVIANPRGYATLKCEESELFAWMDEGFEVECYDDYSLHQFKSLFEVENNDFDPIMTVFL